MSTKPIGCFCVLQRCEYPSHWWLRQLPRQLATPLVKLRLNTAFSVALKVTEADWLDQKETGGP